MVTLGGSRNFDCENINLCRHESAAIRERCETLVPSLRNMEIVREEVGFRPHREGNVRVEADRVSDHCSKAIVSIFVIIRTIKIISINSKINTHIFLQIVHNYGHGGYGVCTAPGTAMYALRLAKDIHRSSTARL